MLRVHVQGLLDTAVVRLIIRIFDFVAWVEVLADHLVVLAVFFTSKHQLAYLALDLGEDVSGTGVLEVKQVFEAS